MLISFEASISASVLGVPAFGDGLMMLSYGGKTQLLFDIMPTGSAGIMDLTSRMGYEAPAISYSSTTSYELLFQTEGDFKAANTNTGLQLYSFTGAGSYLKSAVLNSDGTLSASRIVTSAGEALENITQLSTYSGTFSNFVALAKWNTQGLETYEIDQNGDFMPLDVVPDTNKSYLYDVSETITVNKNGQEYLLTASAKENGLTLFRTKSDGSLELHDSLGNHDGLPVNGLCAISIIEAWGETFAVVGATLTSSVSTVRINDMGVLFPADHITDDTATKFEHLAALGTFSAQGRAFVVAAGTDAGVTVLEILPGGELVVAANFLSDAYTPIRTVTGIEVSVVGDHAHIFLAQATRSQLIEFTVPLASLGSTIDAAGGRVTTGTSLDDLIFGSNGNDDIRGGSGDDRIIDGDGLDILRGNGGLDVFVFGVDDYQDQVLDFQMGYDRIDISAWGRLYSVSEIDIIPISGGAEIRFGDNSLIIITSNGRMLTEENLDNSDFIF